MRRIAATLVFVLLAGALVGAAGEIPPRPEQIDFPPLSFTPPDPDAMRFELSNGVPVYANPDTQFPLVTVAVLFRGGQYIEPADKSGLASITSDTWRAGGAGELTAQELDEELDFLAAQLSTSIGPVSGSANLNVMTKDFDTALDLMMDVLTRPRFQEDRFLKAKDDLIQNMKERNDHAARIESREWDRLLYGDDYWQNRLPTKASVDAVTREDCAAFVDRLIAADNIVIAVGGAFDRAGLRADLERTFGTLKAGETPIPDVPQPDHVPEPGVYVVDKPDVNQGRVSLGHLGLKQGHPDEFALNAMNFILGGSGFTSRITQRVRSDEGLAYTARSAMRFPVTVPGTFRAFFQTKSRTVPAAIDITTGLIRQIRTEKVADDELSTAKTSMIETFPRRFESAAFTARLYAQDELFGRSHDYWMTWRDKVRALDRSDILAAAQEHLHPDDMVILIVGNLEEIEQGHPDYEASLAELGTLHQLPLRDPMTLEPMSE